MCDAFSGIIVSMQPTNEACPDKAAYDEFGFKLENNLNNRSQSPASPKLFKSAVQEVKLSLNDDQKHKSNWLEYLEFALNVKIGDLLAWNQAGSLSKNDKLRTMIRELGIPHSFRSFVWMRITSAHDKKSNSKFKYNDLFKNIEHDQYHTSKQIEKDLLRTLPSNYCFSSQESPGIYMLRRILQALAWIYPSIGYCQGMGTIAASLLLFLEEEDAFWMMSSIIEDILPQSYYSHTLLGVQADMKVLRQLIRSYLPEIDEQFKKYDIEFSLICINWFLTIFSNVFHMKVLLRVWDVFFYEGSTAMFQITLALLKLNEKNILEANGSSQIFGILSCLPDEINDVDLLIETSIRIASSVNKNTIDVSRRKHQAYLIAQNGVQTSNFSNEHSKFGIKFENNNSNNVNKGINILKLLKRSFKNGLHDFNKNRLTTNDETLSHEQFPDGAIEDGHDSIKMKNIVQTELLVNLREVIAKIAEHFRTNDAAKYANCHLSADYSIESHNKDYENYLDTSKVRRYKRAKAILDFEKSDNDELGFRKNDIITILSTKDDHCWIGEKNGDKGWFPSRFVSIIDERNGKIYSPAGDDSFNDKIRELVRGDLCTALKAIFEHGLKKWRVLGGNVDPWTFIEEASKKVVEKDFESVYSRLVLCKTFRLDEDGKVLTPDELLFRSVKLINFSHNSFRADSDVKFRSLICIALNEQVLHIWLETLCSNLETIEKWYNEWSFMRSPGWVQIKCELRLLSQFSFFLNQDAELANEQEDIDINECIQDMLIKHHLFSWEI